MHAAAIAAELGIGRVLCPRAGGVLSALGLCASERRRDTARTVMLGGGDLSAERVAAEVAALVETAGAPAGAEPEVVYEMRYAGQAFELPIPGPTTPDPEELADRFEAAHRERYGHSDPDGEVVLVHIRLAMVSPAPDPRPTAAESAVVARLAREVRFAGEWVETPVIRGEPPAGMETDGPAVFELPEATFVLPPGWHARVDEAGTILAEADR
jgi:N-methylhydantoinase A/oxoprolinase/acetone carboxylase beta subunit